jgi:hypothetical protein
MPAKDQAGAPTPGDQITLDSYEYDAAGQLRRIVDNGGAVRMADNWYTYDRENRITLTQGELVDVC